MRFRIKTLRADFRRSTEQIDFTDFTYFYGKMGAGKTSIALLIDFCLGGRLDPTPALQSEFVAAELTVEIEGIELVIYRQYKSGTCVASWERDGEKYGLSLPAKTAKGEVLPGTGVAVLSDLIFHIAGIEPPRVRRSKLSEDTTLVRLSFRDLLWYCYLEQKPFESDLFQLNSDFAPTRLKSLDVMRSIVGFHQEQVAELEFNLDQARTRRLTLREAARVLERSLSEAGIATLAEVETRQKNIKDRLAAIGEETTEARATVEHKRNHISEQLRGRAAGIIRELEVLEQALRDADQARLDETQHLNELKVLQAKLRRNTSAKAVLSAVEFEACPRCAQSLPSRPADHCPVCGQDERPPEATADIEAEAREDLKEREAELGDLLKRRATQIEATKRRLTLFIEEKGRVDAELSAVQNEYDSAVVAATIHLVGEKATLEQEERELGRLQKLHGVRVSSLEEATELDAKERLYKEQLSAAREAAQKDLRNLRRLEQLFLDCLVRSELAGFSAQDSVMINPNTFMPVVSPSGMGEFAVTTFSNVSSGGITTLFKACYALAIHRLAAETGALLPSLLIIDSAMKNTSERMNREQFEAFHRLLYELAVAELRKTQFILIDKEVFFPADGVELEFSARLMNPGDPVNPPLIHYYQVDTEAESTSNQTQANPSDEAEDDEG